MPAHVLVTIRKEQAFYMRPSITAMAGFILRHRLTVLLVWMAILTAGIVMAPRFPQQTSGGGFEQPGSDSWRASTTLQDEFGRSYGHTVQLLFADEDANVNDPGFRSNVEDTVDRVMLLPGASESVNWYNAGLPDLVSPDGHATYALVTFTGSEESIQRQIPDIRGLVAKADGIEAYVIGGPAFNYDLQQTSEQDLRLAETYGLPVVAVILVLVFGSLVASALPALLGGISVVVTLASLFVLGHWTPLSIFVLNMVSMLGLGLGIDYSLFIVSRFREELAAGHPATEAVIRTVGTAGRAVVFSGAAVIVGMAMLVLFDIVFMKSLGIGGVLVAAWSMLVAVTLLPAVLAMLGPRVDALRILPFRYLRGSGSRFWHSWSLAVMKRPLVFLLLSMALLLALAWPVRYMKSGSPGINDLSPQSESRTGIELLAKKWSPGSVSPVYIVIDTGENYGVFDFGVRTGLAELEQRLADDDRVERVESIAGLDLPAEPMQLQVWASTNPENAIRAASLINLGGGARKTMAMVIPEQSSSYETRQLVSELRSDLLPQINGFDGTEVLVGGSAAEVVDFTQMLKNAFPYLLAAVLLITYLVLLLLFRSLVLPLKAIFMNLLSVAAAYGVLVLVFQDGWGEGLLNFVAPGGILPFVPVILFSILFGLSMDYEVFLLSRIKEEFDRSGDNERAVALGLERTGGIITSAALIMIVVFGSFAFTRSIIIKEFGVGLAVSIFLDATVVRIILVPATMKLMGGWNWWLPGWLDRLLPDLSLKH